MAQHHTPTDLYAQKFAAPAKMKTLMTALLVIGALAFVYGLIKDQDRLWTAYLVAFFFFTSLALGGLFFTAINNLTHAGWSVTIRRYAEAMTAFIPFIFVGGLVLALVGMKHLYPWADPEQVASNPIISAKSAYLNVGFFIVRLIIFCGGWFAFKWVIVGNSIHQDVDGREDHTLKNVGLSVAFVVFFALSYSLFSVDLLMSLLPTWYSTIFGVYCFAGLFQASLAFLALILIFMRKSGLVRGYVNTEHQHDIAKYMKGFTVFWAYIAFSQFMLIWYANIPEETEYYIMRSQHGWLGVSMALLVFRFIVPFIALLPRGLKRNENHVVLIACLILVMEYVDIWWMVYPNFFDGQMTFGVLEIGLFALFLGLFLFALFSFFKKFSPVAIRDPRLQEALDHRVTY